MTIEKKKKQILPSADRRRLIGGTVIRNLIFTFKRFSFSEAHLENCDCQRTAAAFRDLPSSWQGCWFFLCNRARFTSRHPGHRRKLRVSCYAIARHKVSRRLCFGLCSWRSSVVRGKFEFHHVVMVYVTAAFEWHGPATWNRIKQSNGARYCNVGNEGFR